MPDHSFRALNLYKAKLLDRIKNVDPSLAEGLRGLKLDWYRIKNEADTGSGTNTEVFIYDEIGGSWGISADEFVNELQDIDSDSITVRINSPGGSVYDAIAMHNALVQHPATVRTRVDSLAASAASVIAMAADPYDEKSDTGGVEMMPGSQMMIHDVMGMEMGNAADFRELATWLDKQSDNIARMYAGKSGGDAEEWRKMMLAETWLFDIEAVQFGLADRLWTPAVKTEEMPPEEEPDGDEPEEGEKEPEGEEEPEEDDEEIVARMSRRHKLTNRGFRHPGRQKAPSPDNVLKAANALHIPKNGGVTDVDAFIAAFSRVIK